MKGAANPFVFIVGCPRSGTTLLERMVGAHPQISVMHETRWIAKFYLRRKGLTNEGHVTSEFIDRLSRYHRFPYLGMVEEDLRALLARVGEVHYSEFVTHIFDNWGRSQGKPLVGEKTPRYVRHIDVLHELWPKARFVHIIRDGRDVGLSTLNWQKSATDHSLWDVDPVSTTALWWEWQVLLGRESGNNLPPDLYHEVRYEALVAEPESSCRRLSAFLGLDFAPSMVTFHEGRTRPKPGRDAKQAWEPVTSGLRDWRSQMSEKEVRNFEACAHELLESLSYGSTPPSSGSRARADDLREIFVADLRDKKFPVPGAWEKLGLSATGMARGGRAR